MKRKKFSTQVVDDDLKAWTKKPKSHISTKQQIGKEEESSDLSSTDEEKIEKYVPRRPKTTKTGMRFKIVKDRR